MRKEKSRKATNLKRLAFKGRRRDECEKRRTKPRDRQNEAYRSWRDGREEGARNIGGEDQDELMQKAAVECDYLSLPSVSLGTLIT